jgi:hypothetical protein
MSPAGEHTLRSFLRPSFRKLYGELPEILVVGYFPFSAPIGSNMIEFPTSRTPPKFLPIGNLPASSLTKEPNYFRCGRLSPPFLQPLRNTGSEFVPQDRVGRKSLNGRN